MNSPQISIPTSYTESNPKPHTVYNVTIRLPLRSFSVAKRYSDFDQLHKDLTSSVGHAPTASLPAKTYFKSTVSDAAFADERRQGLEAYLLAIQTSPDKRWRESPAWRQFLNLPSSASGFDSSSSVNVSSHLGSLSGPPTLTNPVLWLDAHREMKSLLQEARSEISRRDQAVAASEQHDASAGAKKSIVKASALLDSLDKGLKAMIAEGKKSGLGEGEIRRRKDLVASGLKERDALETLANSMASRKSQGVEEVEVTADALRTAKGALNGRSVGRVLGGPIQETERTRQLGNQGLVQLQQEYMQSQDQDLESLLKAVTRQKQMGIEIGQELDEQNKLLDELDVDVERVDNKLRVVSKRMKKIH